MNKTYKSIWNESLGTYVAAAEVTAAGGRKASSARKARRAPLRAHAGQMALEQRIVFDAALPATVMEVQADGADHASDVIEIDYDEPDTLEPAVAAPGSSSSEQEARVDEASADDETSVAPEDVNEGTDISVSNPAPSDGANVSDADEVASDGDPDQELELAQEAAWQEIIFIDAVVPDIGDFLQNHTGEVIYLDATRDGVEQIAEVLQGRTGVTAIHIISHAEAGQIRLGSALLNADSLQGEHADEMAIIRTALAVEADILLYGCDIAADENGLQFVQALADATGADVAASIDTTGSAELGGNWVLEVQHGQIDAQTLAVTAWHGVLAQNNTGAWTITGTTASQGSTASASTTTAGVTTTVSFSGFSTPTTNVTGFVGGTASNLNTIPVFNSDGGGAVQGTPSLTFLYNWDSTPEDGASPASSGGGTALMTITFSQPITNPVLHLDRIGGSGGGVHNGMSFTLQDSGLSLVRLSGTDHFAVVGGNVIRNSQLGQAVGSGYTAESNTNINLGTAAGSVLVNGTNITSITFLMSFDVGSVEGAGGDAVELKVSLDPAPIARNDAFTTAEDTSVSGNLFANNGSGADSDFNSDPLTITAVNGVAVTQGVPIALANGTLTITNVSTGTFTFAPNPDYNGTQSFNYTIRDPRGSTSTANVSITVTPVNDAPVAVDDSFTTNEDTSVVISVLGNDTDVDGNALTVTQIDGQPATVGSPVTLSDGSGTATLNANGTITYNPAPDYNGPVNFVYQITDGNGSFDTATVTGTVNPVNDPPVAIDDVATTDEDTAVTVPVLVNDTDVDGDPLIVTAATAPNGTVVINGDGTVTYTPNPNFNGTDTITYTISDGNGGTATATVTITVNPVNDTPTSTPIADQSDSDSDVVSFDVSGSFADVDVATNGDSLSYGAVGLPPGLSIDPVTGVISGTLNASASQGGPASDGVYSVTVTATDSGGLSTSQSFTWTVGNPPPVATDDAFTTDEDTAVGGNLLGNDSDADGDALTVTANTDPANGTVVVNPDGTFTYTPNANFNGTDSFSYTITDADGATSTATVTITVNPVNDTPTSTPIADQSDSDSDVVSFDVSGSFADVDVATNGDSLSYGAVGLPPGLTIDPVTGLISGTLTNDASQGGPGSDGVYSVTITATDSGGLTSSQTFTWTIGNPAPDALDDGFTAVADAPLAVVGDALGNDVDPDGDVLTVSAVNGAPGNVGVPVAGSTGGLFTVNADGTVSFDPNGEFDALPPGDTATTTVTYTISDGQGGTDTATITVTVTGINNEPVATDDVFTVGEDDAPAGLGNVITGDTGAGADSDIDGGTLTVAEVNGVAGNVGVPVAGSTGGLFTVNPDGTVTFDPNGEFEDLAVGESTTTTVTYTISDGQGGTDTATITVTVTGVNDAPEVVVGSEVPDQSGNDGEAIVPVDVTGAFTDVDGDTLSYSAAGLPPGLGIDPVTGVISGTPTSDASQGGPTANGIYSVTVTATDPSGASVDQVFTFTIGNPAPVAVDDTAVTDEDTPVSIDVLANDSDPDADPLTVTSASAGNGTVVINGDGTVTYTPAPNFNGLDTITYTISDGNGGTATATVTVTVNPVNDPPVAVDDVITTRLNEPVSGNVLDNDSDVDGDPLNVVEFEVGGVTYPAGDTATMAGVGTLVINPDGSFTFTPQTGYSGPVPAVTYTISDGVLTDTAQLLLSDVPAPPPAPPVPSPAPPPLPPITPVLPEESTDTPRNPGWGQNPESGRPGVGMLPISSNPALHVLYAVGSSSTERALAGSALGAFQANAPLLAEAMGQLPDSLLFSGMGDGDAPALIRESGRGEVQTIRHALHVQHAVRHMPVTSDHGLFVQKAVRAAQLEAAVRGAVLDAHQSATPGFESLLDPFGLGSPKPVDVSEKTSQASGLEPVQAKQAHAGQQTADAVTESTQAAVDTSVFIENADAPQEAEPIQPMVAQGFRTQLQRMATDRSVTTRPLTRNVNPS